MRQLLAAFSLAVLATATVLLLAGAGIGRHRPRLGLAVEVVGVGQVVSAVHVGLDREEVLRIPPVLRDARNQPVRFADRLEEAAERPSGWLGSTTRQ